MNLHRAKKSMGQNFLNDRGVVTRIIDTVGCTPSDWILEIGPGRGAITRHLVESGANVVAVELDRQLLPDLAREFTTNANIEIVSADILKLDLGQFLQERWPGPWKVAANLPYNISSQVLFKFLDHRQRFSRLVLMLQKEVGDRLAAPPGCKDYGILSVLCGLHFDIKREFIVRPGAFHPVPKVDSAVLSFTALSAPRFDVGDEAIFRRLVKDAFSQRRKTLWNCLRTAESILGNELLQEVLDNCGIDGKRRGETLSISEYAQLAKGLIAARLRATEQG
jgi:16S rRNA (adenine1518-N6/adenine1519-N6)-dimethyltransferase